MLLRGKEAFEARWRRGTTDRWTAVGNEERLQFVHGLVGDAGNEEEQLEAVECLANLAMGSWGETAGQEQGKPEEPTMENSKQEEWGGVSPAQFPKSMVQMEWIKRNCTTLVECGAVRRIFDILRRACDGEQSVGPLPLIQPYPATTSRFLLTKYPLETSIKWQTLRL